LRSLGGDALRRHAGKNVRDERRGFDPAGDKRSQGEIFSRSQAQPASANPERGLSSGCIPKFSSTYAFQEGNLL